MVRLYPAQEHRSFTFGSSAKRALLIHGFPGTPWEMRALGVALAEMGWQAHGPLLPGFGPSIESLGDRRWRDWEESVSESHRSLLDGADELLLVGYSMGAALAVRLAARLQGSEIEHRLILINPFTGIALPLASLLSMISPFVRSYRPFVRVDFDDPWVREVLGRILPDLDIDDLSWRERLRREVRVPLRAVEQARRLGTAAWRAAPGVEQPALVLQGREDEVVSPARTRRFVRRLSGAVRYQEAPGGHVLIWPGKPGHQELMRELEAFAGKTVRRAAVKASSPRRIASGGDRTRPPSRRH